MALETVGDLEEALFSAFPREDAEDWDHPGLSVGDRSARIGKVAFNLDQDVEAVVAASEAGCNVLVTHHPAFIKGGPAEFGPAGQEETSGPGRMVYEAASRGVSLIAMHTNADRAVETREAYAKILGCSCEGNFEHLVDPSRSASGAGLGAVLLPAWEGPHTLAALADRCLSVFGGMPRVWGDPERELTRVAVLNGSWSEPELPRVCRSAGVECMVVGETRYHGCVDAQPGLSIVELGHDRSEFPIVDVLERVVASQGVDASRLVRLRCSEGNWWIPGTES